MVGIMTFPRTTIGKKVIMAVTGLIWVGFLAFHMYGNLKFFGGAEYYNHYAEGLRSLGSPVFGHEHILWVLRIIVLPAFVLHAWAGITLKTRNLASRGSDKYQVKKSLASTPAGLSMIFGGLFIIFFVLFHLLDLTLGAQFVNPAFVMGDAYNNVLATFNNPLKVVIYLLALVALALHLYHGVWSMFQTLGLNNKDWTGIFRGLAWGLAVIVPLGFALLPITIMFGLV